MGRVSANPLCVWLIGVKTLRERAEGLVSIAHPDFRAELRKEARRLLWP